MTTGLAPMIVHDATIERIPLAQKLATILGDVGRVEKRGQIRSQGSGPSYNFARDSDVLEAVNPKMAEAGIVLIPERTQLLSLEPNMRGTQIIANILTSWHVTDGHESLRFQTLGQGQDSGDKALPKAQSNARKYAFFMLFHIVTGDDPDQHASEQSQGGERSPASGGARSEAATTRPAMQPRNKGEALAALAEVGRDHGMSFAQIEERANSMGIDRGSATVDDIMRVVASIETPASGVPSAAGREGGGGADRSEPASPSSEDTPEEPPVAPKATPEAGGVPPVASPPAAPTDAEILAAAGEGAEIVPPRPATDAYKALSAPEKAAARAYWQRVDSEPQQETLAAALGSPVEPAS